MDHIRHVRQRRQGLVTAARSSTATASSPTPSATGTCRRSTRRSRSSGCRSEWSEEEYGAQARRSAAARSGWPASSRPTSSGPAGLPEDPDGQAAEVAKWHKRKTAIYTEMVAAGKLPPRPGIRRIISRGPGRRLEARRRLDVGRAIGPGDPRATPSARSGPPGSTSSSPATSSPKKKPAPDIYLLALERLGVPAAGRARRRGLAQRPAGRRRRRAALPHDRQRLHGGGGQQRSNPRRVVARRSRTASGRA